MIFMTISEESGENIVVKWENIVSSLDFCERPEDSARILLFPASSSCARSRDLSMEFFCEGETAIDLYARPHNI